jgi:hypothetical protein
LQFAPATTPPKIAKEYVFANALGLKENSQWVTMNINNSGFVLNSKVVSLYRV